MSCFNTVLPEKKLLDPSKRVKYSYGLVLGVDEFDQDQFYLMEKDRCHNRRLHGYGTVLGLHLTLEDIEEADNGDIIHTKEVKVAPGIAINPQGQPICVPEAQCANIDAWLAEHKELLEETFEDPTANPVELYIVLCYKECETDMVPIPGKPCRTLEDSNVPSRIADDYILCLSLTKPEGKQEEYTTYFGNFFAQLALAGTGDTPAGWDKLQDYLDELKTGPVSETGTIYLDKTEAPNLVRSIYRYWITNVLPEWLKNNGGCAMRSSDEKCVLLGTLELSLQLTNDIYMRAGNVELNEDDRPVLVPSRLLQEQAVSSCTAITSGGNGGGTPTPPPTPIIRTRIVATNWTHNGTSDLILPIGTGKQRGIAIAFGKADEKDKGQVLTNTINENNIEIFAQISLAAILGGPATLESLDSPPSPPGKVTIIPDSPLVKLGKDAMVSIKLTATKILVLGDITVDTNGLITKAKKPPSSTPKKAKAIFFQLNDDVITNLLKANNGAVKITVKLSCDLILDESSKSISIAALPAPRILGKSIKYAESELSRGGGEFISSVTIKE
jgi:hypothetical protein